MRKLALHWQILIGMALGILFGVAANYLGYTNPEGSIIYTAKKQNNNIEAQDLKILIKDLSTDKKDTLQVLLQSSVSNVMLPAKYYAEIKIDSKTSGEYKLIQPTDQAKYEFIKVLTPLQKQVTVKPASSFVNDWIKPFGTIIINLLKLIAIPLIIASLIKGISDLQDISKLSAMGGRTIGLYILTTVVAVTIGLLIVNIFQPGNSISL